METSVSWFVHLQETWLGSNVSWFVHLQETWLGNNVSWFVHVLETWLGKNHFLLCSPSGNMARKQCFLVCPPSGNMARKQCFFFFSRIDKISISRRNIGDEFYKYCIILAIRFAAYDSLQHKFPRAFPKLPFGRRSCYPMRVETGRNVSSFLRVFPLVEQGERKPRVYRPG